MKKSALGIWLLLIGAFILTMTLFDRPSDPERKVGISEFMDQVVAGEVEEVLINGPDVVGKTKGGETLRSYTSDREELLKLMREKEVKFAEQPPSNTDQYLMLFLKLLLPLIFLIFLFRMMKNAGNNMKNISQGFTTNKAHLIQDKDVRERFSDVAGIEEAVEEVRELVTFLKEPDRFSKIGARIPKGTLFIGPSGTGKTLLAKAVAGEAGVPFFSVSGSGFVEMFVGVGASRVRDLFENARKQAPCIVFIDELDAIGKKRGGISTGGGNDEREQTLNELLIAMDGFDGNEGVLLIAATNRPDVLDSALTRPGRFDRTVVVPVPDLRGRDAILRVHARKYRLDQDVDLHIIARGTPGMTGADLENILNEAALVAARRDREAIAMEDLQEGIDKVLMGPARKSAVMTEHEKNVVAYHEAGHAVVAWFTPHSDPVHKVTVIPRGRALGITALLPEEDRRLPSRNELLARIDGLLGGRLTEALMFKDVTTGAGNDLERATELAYAMVTQLGMSDALGLRTYGKRDQGFLLYDYSQRDYSDETATEIDREIRRILDESKERVQKCLQANWKALEALVAGLLDRETLDSREIEGILGPRATA